MQKNYKTISAPFWIVLGIEYWKRFGFYNFQAIIASYSISFIDSFTALPENGSNITK